NLYNQLNAVRNAVNNYIQNGCSFTSQPQPINDYCSGAIDLTSSTSCNYQTFTTSGATGSLAATNPCNGTTNGVADDDVWFKFVATSNQHTLQLLNGNNFDGVLDVRNGCYSSSSSIGCDNQPGSSGVLNTVSLNNLTIGTTYYARVYHHGTGSGGGSFQLCLTHPQPTCQAPSGRNISNLTATSVRLAWNAVSGAANYEVWYRAAGQSAFTKVNSTSTSLTLNNLSCNTNYEWSVMAYCSNGANSGAPSTFSTFTTPNDLPDAIIQHSAVGYTVSFSANTTGNPTSFTWNFGDGSTANTQQNPTHTYPANGVPTNYTVTLTLSNYCGSKTITYGFTLIPDCQFSLSPKIMSIDSNFQTLQLQLSNPANCPWASSALCNFAAVFPASGQGSATLSVTVSENNDTFSRSCVIIAGNDTFFLIQSGKKAPAPCNFSINPDSATLDSNSHTFNIQLNTSPGCSWTSFVPCQFISLSTSSGTGPGNISVQVDANNDTLQRICRFLIAGQVFTLIQSGKKPPAPALPPCYPGLPTPLIIANGCDLASSPAIPNVSYSWYKNGVLIPGVNSRFYTVEDDKGYFYVVITDSNNCTAQSADIYVDCTLQPTSIEEAATEDYMIQVTPNPADRYLFIRLNSEKNLSSELHLFDELGRCVASYPIYSNLHSIDISCLPQAIYFFKLKSEQRNVCGRFLVKR
ncbi:MAG: PKD domain-containing protein, partial [Chitinophagales bacterium]|nr:PKD domain-containing protein [Chitinophagales bacterium]